MMLQAQHDRRDYIGFTEQSLEYRTRRTNRIIQDQDQVDRWDKTEPRIHTISDKINRTDRI
jgi:hypothetical protein